jgi:hypothetical protein
MRGIDPDAQPKQVTADESCASIATTGSYKAAHSADIEL